MKPLPAMTVGGWYCHVMLTGSYVHGTNTDTVFAMNSKVVNQASYIWN